MEYKKVLIISESSSFPWGMASASRVRNIAKGLIASGVHVAYVGLRGATVDFSTDKKRNGNVQGIEYSYPGGFAVSSNNWWVRRLDDFLGKWLSVVKILSLKLRGEIDVVILYSRNHKVVIFWSKLLRMIKVPVVLELCEWPLAIAETKGKGFEYARKFCHNAVLSVDAILPISCYIENEVKKIAANAQRDIPLLKIPILVDTEINEDTKKTESMHQYLLYCGSISYMDIARFIVDVSCELKKRGRDISIKFTGGGSPDALNKLKEYANEKGVLDHFQFTGFVYAQELHELMAGALALLAPLPDDLQSQARFPTKLAYYLSSGSPVITTAVGSVNEYLVDSKNAFIAETYAVDKIADKIECVVDDPALALQVSKKGQDVAFKEFYFKNACKGLKEFLFSLESK